MYNAIHFVCSVLSSLLFLQWEMTMVMKAEGVQIGIYD